MRISMIVATDRNRLIGADNQLPWHLPADLKHFKQTTMGKPLIMGRKTHESIGRPLPGRRNIVISRNPQFNAPGCEVVHSIEAAFAAAGECDEVMVMGGAAIYAETLARAERIYLTCVDAEFEGDAWFPELPDDEWKVVASESHTANKDNPHAYRFLMLERNRSSGPQAD